MSGLGNIMLGNDNNSAGGGIVVAGARNGASVDGSGFIVLGQSVSAAGNPAILLNNREIPMATFRLNLFNGNLVVSDAQNAGTGARSEVIDTIAGTVTTPAVRLSQTWNGSSAVSPQGILVVSLTNNNANAGNGLVFNHLINGFTTFQLSANGLMAFCDSKTGVEQIGFATGRIVGIALPSPDYAMLDLTGNWNPSAAANGEIADIACISAVNLSNAATIDYACIRLGSQLRQSGTSNGIIRGIVYQPSIAVTLPVQPRAWENTVGDVYLCSQTGGVNNQGRVCVWQGLNGPTGIFSVGPSDGNPGNASINIQPGAILLSPEDGSLEYDGTNLYFTVGATRKMVTLI